MMNLLAQIDPETLAHSAAELAAKSDRTLFIATLLFMLASGVYIVRYLVRRNDVLTEKLEQVARDSTKINMEVAQCLTKISDRLDAHTTAVKGIGGKIA